MLLAGLMSHSPLSHICFTSSSSVFLQGMSFSTTDAHLLLQVIPVSRQRGALVDIAISGLPGWITVMSPGVTGEIRMRLWSPVGVEVFVRPPMPVDESRDRLHADPFW